MKRGALKAPLVFIHPQSYPFSILSVLYSFAGRPPLLCRDAPSLTNDTLPGALSFSLRLYHIVCIDRWEECPRKEVCDCQKQAISQNKS